MKKDRSCYIIVASGCARTNSRRPMFHTRYPVKPVSRRTRHVSGTLRPPPFPLSSCPAMYVFVLLRVARCRVKNNTLSDIYSDEECGGGCWFEKGQARPTREKRAAKKEAKRPRSRRRRRGRRRKRRGASSRSGAISVARTAHSDGTG